MNSQELKTHTLKALAHSKDVIHLYGRCAILDVTKQEIMERRWNGLRIRYFFGGGKHDSQVSTNITKYINRTHSISISERTNTLFLSALNITNEILQKKQNKHTPDYNKIRKSLIINLPKVYMREIKALNANQSKLILGGSYIQNLSVEQPTILQSQINATEKLIIESYLNTEGMLETSDKLNISYRRTRQILDKLLEEL